jgi:hypothetical protein
VTRIRIRWDESEDNVLRTSLAARVSPRNIADFLARDLHEVLERINYLNRSAQVTPSEASQFSERPLPKTETGLDEEAKHRLRRS